MKKTGKFTEGTLSSNHLNINILSIYEYALSEYFQSFTIKLEIDNHLAL